MIITHRAKRKQKIFPRLLSHLFSHDAVLVVPLVKCTVKASAVQKMPHIVLVQIHHTHIILVIFVILIIATGVTHTHIFLHIGAFLRKLAPGNLYFSEVTLYRHAIPGLWLHYLYCSGKKLRKQGAMHSAHSDNHWTFPKTSSIIEQTAILSRASRLLCHFDGGRKWLFQTN